MKKVESGTRNVNAGATGSEAPESRLAGAAAFFAALLLPVAVCAQDTKSQAPAPPPGAVDAGENENETTEAESDDWLPGEVTGSVALTSNYVDRGLTNSSNDPAIQGSLDYAVPTGIGDTKGYVGFWSSSVDLEGDNSTAHVEIDAMFGLRGEVGDFGWDVGGTYLYYPGTRSADNFNYWEIPVVLTYQATEQLGLEVVNIFAWENQFDTGLANYVTGNVYYDIPVPYVGLQLFTGVGYQYIEDDYNGIDWRLGATVTVKGVDLSVAYTDTNYRARDIGNNQGDAKVVFAVGMDF
ncbi:MAG: hypothetical protein JNM75_06250 [Rhodospirillales bacterium]|nr:hypothetical protein [Rhodospirillales bacterium]